VPAGLRWTVSRRPTCEALLEAHMLPADVVLEVESDQVILATGHVGRIFIGAAVVRANDGRRDAQPAHLSRESGTPRPHLRQDWARIAHICTGTQCITPRHRGPSQRIVLRSSRV
jgi:hypothetical protein